MERFHWQERVWTCGPAAMRIALLKIGINKSERFLGKILKTNMRSGTANKNFKKAARKLNLNYVEGEGNLNLIEELLNKKFAVVVNYLAKIHGMGHFATIKKITNKKVYLLDPASGPNLSFDKKYFNKIWHSEGKRKNKWFIAISNKKI